MNSTNELQFSISQDEIKSLIMTIRGKQVMIDRDIAVLYQVETKALNQSVKRNLKRFPERYMFQLSETEMIELVTNCDRLQILKHSSTPAFVFTEQGITQLSAVLHSDVAIEMSIRINDAFHTMRHYVVANNGVIQRLENVERKQLETDNKIEFVLNQMEKVFPKEPNEKLFPNGCVFDAWIYLSELVKKAKKRIILIDNYCDERTLALLTKRATGVTAVIHSRYSAPFEEDLKKHNAQYPDASIEFIQLPHKEHDRFLIVDDDVYMLGDSIKNLGHSLTAVLKTRFSVAQILAEINTPTPA